MNSGLSSWINNLTETAMSALWCKEEASSIMTANLLNNAIMLLMVLLCISFATCLVICVVSLSYLLRLTYLSLPWISKSIHSLSREILLLVDHTAYVPDTLWSINKCNWLSTGIAGHYWCLQKNNTSDRIKGYKCNNGNNYHSLNISECSELTQEFQTDSPNNLIRTYR